MAVGGIDVIWNASLTKDVRNAAARGLDKAAEHLREKLIINVGTLGPPRSLPGNFPHIDTGELHGSFRKRTNKRELVSRVGTKTEHAWYLEFGTSRMEPRPFLKRTMNEEKKVIVNTIIGELQRVNSQ